MKKLFGVLKYIKGYWGYASLNIASNIFTIVFGLFSLTMAIPFLDLLFQGNEDKYQEILAKGAPGFSISVRSMLDNLNFYFTNIIVSQGKVQALFIISVAVVIIFFFKNLFRYLALFFMAPVRNGIVRDMRNNIYKKTLQLPLSYYSDERKGDIMSRITTDVQEVEWSVLTGLELIFRDPLTVLLYLTFLVFMSPMLTLLVFVLLPLIGGLIVIIGRSLKRSASKAKERLGVIFSIMEETLSGLRIIKGFNAEKYQENKFFAENEAYTRLQVRTYRKVDLSSPMSEFMGTLIMMMVLFFGGKLVLGDEQMLKASEFIAYLLIFSQIIPPAKSITTAYYNVQRGMASIERINKILDAEITIRENEGAKTITGFNKEIEYKNVFFAYVRGDSGYVLRNINLKVEKGKTIALVGQSGSGKSTLADMLPRFYDIDAGELLIDGNNIKDLKLYDLRQLLGIVTQESILFNDTVFNNIAFGMKDVKEADVIAAAKIANAHEFISQMPNGYQTNIGDRGSKLSGGQRQRLSIARAVLKNPPILILDEATSALDTESERLVQDALARLMQNRTSIVIAHRLSTIQHADEIIVLQKGEIIERGTHNVLIGQSGAYKKLYDLQSFV
jgi:ABC-type multidrug transport system fused ATPase/permease subunit